MVKKIDKVIIGIFLILTILISGCSNITQTTTGAKANLDDDGNGIPNKDDPDFIRQGDGTGNGVGNETGAMLDANNNRVADGKENFVNNGITNNQDEDYTQ